jgi:putative flippase GtrA
MTTGRKWLRFNLVGVAGFAIQVATLAALARWTPAPAGVAVIVAVLVAVSHNFLWHERVTWSGLPRERRWRRWVAFNCSNGLISVVTNVVVTGGVMAATDASLLAANVVAVVAASFVNFFVSDRLVFTPSC